MGKKARKAGKIRRGMRGQDADYAKEERQLRAERGAKGKTEIQTGKKVEEL